MCCASHRCACLCGQGLPQTLVFPRSLNCCREATAVKMQTVRALTRTSCAGAHGHARVLAASVARPARPSRRQLTAPVCFREKEDDTSVSKRVETNVNKAVSSAEETMSGLLSSSSSQAQSYWVLGSLAAATAVAALLAPGAFASTLFQAPTDALVDTMTRMTGATLLATAASKYTLKEAAAQGELQQDTFKRLNIGLMVQCALCLGVLVQGASLRTPLLVGFLGGVCGMGVLVTSRIYSLVKGGIPFPSPSHTLSDAVSTLMPQNLFSMGYSLLTVAMTAMAVVCLGATPGASLVLYDGVMGPMTVFMKRVAGAGMVLMALQAFSLKDAADRGKLGALTFRWMNLGLGGALLMMSLVTAANLQSGLMITGPKAWSMLAASLAGAAYCAFQYATATADDQGNTTVVV